LKDAKKERITISEILISDDFTGILDGIENFSHLVLYWFHFICVLAVPLLERKGNVVKVKGLDAIDGSPVIDIKPYVPSYYAVNEAKASNWVRQIEREFAEALKGEEWAH